MAADGHLRMTALSRVILASAGLSCLTPTWLYLTAKASTRYSIKETQLLQLPNTHYTPPTGLNTIELRRVGVGGVN